VVIRVPATDEGRASSGFNLFLRLMDSNVVAEKRGKNMLKITAVTVDRAKGSMGQKGEGSRYQSWK